MDAHGVDVLYGADHDDVIGEVAHDLQLELLPACDALLDEGRVYGAGVESVCDGAAEFGVVAGRGPSLAAQGEAGADDEGVTDLLGQLLGFREASDRAARRDLQADTLHRLGEQLAVLGLTDRGYRGAEELHVQLVEDA